MSFTIIPREQPELMAKLRLISLAQALHMEVAHNMYLSRGVKGLQIAKSMGFKGSRKPAALHWVIAQMREQGIEIQPRLLQWEEANPQ